MNLNLDQLVNENKICVRCLGRTQGTKGMTDLDASTIQAKSLPNEIVSNTCDHLECEFCEGLIEKSINTGNEIIEILREYEFETILVGCSVPNRLEQKDQILKKYSKELNELKFDIRKEIGLRIVKELDKTVEFRYPEITVVLDIETQQFEMEVRSLYILGKYKKLERGLPQTKWPCSNCRGRGCDDCDQTGQQYPLTVETAIAPAFLEATQAEDESFHGAGREDIDALMLGTGRPFVLELKSPKKRTIDLSMLQEVINQSGKVEINNLSYTDKDTIVKLKQSSPNASKTYRALINVNSTVNEEHIEKINIFGSETQQLEQRTPTRVSHRRADRIRKKKIYSVKAEKVDDKHIEVEIKAQGGAYIKEFISSDEGRTFPSIANLIDMEARCEELDVIQVDDKGLF